MIPSLRLLLAFTSKVKCGSCHGGGGSVVLVPELLSILEILVCEVDSLNLMMTTVFPRVILNMHYFAPLHKQNNLLDLVHMCAYQFSCSLMVSVVSGRVKNIW